MDVVLASGNPGKLRELASMLDGRSMDVRLQSDFDVPPVAETGTTFVENAIIKARHAARHTGLAAIADDSGIIVDALGGAPGVRSARYAGAGASDADNLRKLLDAMADVADPDRSCRFVCVIAMLRHAADPLPLVATGTWEGSLLRTPRGANGFGYDPIFHVPDHDCTSAELEPDVKNRISHRARALAALLEQLETA